ncbi:MAG: LysM peptidoglycan-binding domain-containing protein [Bacilli bacterium]|nr:LysM peptidoglycan-binding domain-containing protein [Bacilli bacterium]
MCPIGTIGHAVRPGETLWMIARRYNTTVRAVMMANPGINPNTLRIGQIICVPHVGFRK